MAVPVSGDAKEMDKYEFNIKVEQIKKMVSRGDYGTAVSYTHLTLPTNSRV